jgi:uncharacterized iron-regulated membrane protein
MNAKKLIGQLHLWLGLSSGLVVFVVAVTGCLYAFKTELEDLTQPYRFIPTQQAAVLPPSAMQAIGTRILPGKSIHSVTYHAGGRAAILSFYHYEPTYYYLAFINPYSGEVLHVQDMSRDFFYQVLQGHFYLWLPPEIGQPVVATATLIFVLLLLSGLVLWWPKNRAAARQRVRFSWKDTTRFKRKNYDLHNVLGFYALVVLLLLSLTGLVWGFQWFARSTYWLTSGGRELVSFYEPQSISTGTAAHPTAIDRLWARAVATHPGAKSIEAHYPESADGTIAISTNPEEGTFWKADHRYYDQRTFQEIPVQHQYGRYHDDLSAADKLARMNYDLHVGAIWGLPGKILMFLASLVAASLPVTGFLIWWGRRKNRALRSASVPLTQRRNRPARPVRTVASSTHQD